MSADSGKPDAGELAHEWHLLHNDIDERELVADLADFQRETLLWAALKVHKKPGLHRRGDCECPRCVLEAAAE